MVSLLQEVVTPGVPQTRQHLGAITHWYQSALGSVVLWIPQRFIAPCLVRRQIVSESSALTVGAAASQYILICIFLSSLELPLQVEVWIA